MYVVTVHQRNTGATPSSMHLYSHICILPFHLPSLPLLYLCSPILPPFSAMPEAGSAVARVTIDESDVLYEEDIQRNPFEVRKK